MNELSHYLQQRFPDFRQEGDPRTGCFGLVVIMKAVRANIGPQRFAVKTVGPHGLQRCGDAIIRKVFERELRVWLRLPSHHNVLPALGLEFAPPPTNLGGLWPVIPLVRMPYCDSSLRDWVEDRESHDRNDRLLGIAQVCSGLRWLYEHGIEGHGDLKPDNLLVVDARTQVTLDQSEELFPSVAHPWIVKVADLGWADAWKGTGGQAANGWRPYTAPERLSGTFVREKSDVFALAVIATELLTGCHPVGVPSNEVGRWKNKKWLRAIERAEWKLPDVGQPLSDVLRAALCTDPAQRPSCDDVRTAALAALPARLAECASSVLRLWTEERRAGAGNRPSTVAAWAAKEVGGMSEENLSREIASLLRLVGSVGPNATNEEAFDFFEVSLAVVDLLLRRGQQDDLAEAAERAAQVVEYALLRFDDLDLRDLRGWEHRTGSDDLKGFDAWEPVWSYAATALAQLREADPRSDVVDALDGELQRKREAREESLEAFIARLSGLS